MPHHSVMDFSTPLPRLVAAMSSSERWWSASRYGDLQAQQLYSILSMLDRGEPQYFTELCEFALATDPDLQSLYTTRITRVAQAEYQITPNKLAKDSQSAKLAAEFCNEALERVVNLEDAKRNLLHAIAVGYSPNEIEWDRDGNTRTNFMRMLHFRHPRRFRYDEKWILRLYDRGLRTNSSNIYGMALDPREWVLHTHQEQAGYPNVAGIMRSVMWPWMLSRWVQKFWINSTERFGTPYIHAEVPPGTTDAVRANIQEALDAWSYDHSAVMEAGTKLTIDVPATATSKESQHHSHLQDLRQSIAKVWLGASDVSDPGAHGSQAAVTARIGAVLDPRMISDGLGLCGTFERSVLEWSLRMNLHKFGGVMPPVPNMNFKTSNDEIKTDLQDLESEDQAAGGKSSPIQVQDTSSDAPTAPTHPDVATTPETTGSQVKADIQASAFNGAQVTSLLAVVTAVAAKQIPREAGVQILQVAFQLSPDEAQAILAPTVEVAAPAPIAAAPVPTPPTQEVSNTETVTGTNS